MAAVLPERASLRAMPSRTALAAALATLCLGASAADAPTLSNRATRTFRVDPTPGKRIAEVKLFATTDDGATWTLAQELLVPADTAEPTRLRWTAPADGAYGLRICVAYTDHQVDPAPQPGQEPEIRLVVDTAAPRIAACAVEPLATPAGHVRVAWSTEDPHPGSSRLEYAPDATTWTTLAELGGAAGERRLALPILADAQRVSLRL